MTAPATPDALSVESLLPELNRPLRIQEGIRRGHLVEVMKYQGEILPSADSPLGKLWHLVHSDSSTVDQCVDIIGLDPALASRVFRVANSSLYHAKAPSLADAVMFLGFSKLRQVVFSAGVFDQFCKLKLPPKWTHFWIRNILVSRLAERIAGDFFRTAGAEYLAGLLHDTGWLILASFFPEELDLILTSPKPPLEAERELLSFNHAHVSAMVCARSGLPARVVHAVHQHQAPDLGGLAKGELPRNSPRFLAIVLHLCDRLATAAQMPLIEGDTATLEAIVVSPEYAWLQAQGLKTDLKALLAEEVPKSKEVYAIFFR